MYFQIVKQITMQKKIYIGFFEDDQGEGRIQIAADIFGLIEMQKIFFRLSDGQNSFNFSDLQFLDNKFRINLVAYSDTMNLGLRLTDNDTYEWRVTKEKWSEFRENLLMLCVDYRKQHIYLESNSEDNSDLQVIFSYDEFKQFHK